MFNEFKVDMFTLMRAITRDLFVTSFGVVQEVFEDGTVQVAIMIKSSTSIVNAVWLNTVSAAHTQTIKPSVGDKCLLVSLNRMNRNIFTEAEPFELPKNQAYTSYGPLNCIALPFSTSIEQSSYRATYSEEGVAIETKDGYTIDVGVGDGGSVNITVNGGNVNITCDEFNVNNGNFTVSK